MKKRFEIRAGEFLQSEELSTNALAVVKQLQEKNITPIEIIDNEKSTQTLYRKGTHDKNYFVRTKDLPTSGQADNNTESNSNTGGNAPAVSTMQKMARPRKNRNVK